MNKWRTHTSQKLYLAGLQLQSWQEFSNDGLASFKPREESFKQSTILLMSAAWDSLINEIAEYHQRPSDLSMTLDRLVGEIGSELPEIQYLTELSRVAGSWISDLQKVSMLIRLPQNKASSAEQDLAENALIATSGAAASIDSLDNLTRILNEFKGYLEELRARMSEW